MRISPEWELSLQAAGSVRDTGRQWSLRRECPGIWEDTGE